MHLLRQSTDEGLRIGELRREVLEVFDAQVEKALAGKEGTAIRDHHFFEVGGVAGESLSDLVHRSRGGFRR